MHDAEPDREPKFFEPLVLSPLGDRPSAVAVGESFEERTGPWAPARGPSFFRSEGGSHGQEHRGAGHVADAGHRVRRPRPRDCNERRTWPASRGRGERGASAPRLLRLLPEDCGPAPRPRGDRRRGNLHVPRGRSFGQARGQAFRILDPARTPVAFNDEWLSRIGLEEFAGLASRFTVQQLVGRDNFKARWNRGEPIRLQETFYPILQAWDACELRADAQVGGSDQLLNIVTASHRLMEACGLAPNVAVIVALLPGTDGKMKMSKSLGNHIPLQSSAQEMFGQLMSLPDQAMRTYFTLLTTLPAPQVEALLAGHPMTAKARLACEVTARFHSPEEADRAAQAFERVFSRGEAPDTMPAHRLVPGETVAAALVRIGAAGSSSEARRLVKEGGVRLDGTRLDDPLAPMRPGVLRAGRRRFTRFES
ncbi:MAG: tyrosine--tRNA ligase [Spirochaetes bacterium]|nr:tyrosine--tRNA ligase [Spirochaetota bacterium]